MSNQPVIFPNIREEYERTKMLESSIAFFEELQNVCQEKIDECESQIDGLKKKISTLNAQKVEAEKNYYKLSYELYHKFYKSLG